MSRSKPAYLRIANTGTLIKDLPDMDSTNTALALAQLQIEATLTVAQAIVELQADLEGIRATILNLR